jgi:mRNA-degrading endonuclease toxin of MazEF toxin-antitoxin module
LGLPVPHPGLVIRYSYLWASDDNEGRDSGIKDRPCVVVLDRQVRDGVSIVTVVAVTHSPPSDPSEAMELPPTVKAHLRLDAQQSWIVLTEVNSFVWPGPDLSPIPHSAPPRFDSGVLPPKYFRKVRDQLVTLVKARRVQIVSRTQ